MIAQVQLKQRMTVAEFDEFALLPENAEYLFEFIGGEVCEVVSNNYASVVASIISFHIHLYLRERGLKGYITGADGGYIVARERYIPDVGYISYERQPHPSREAYNPNPPDLAVEVLSPTDSMANVRIKMNNYAQANVTVWIVDPESQTVEIYTPGQSPQKIGIDGTLDGGAILPGFTLAVKDIFPSEETE